MGVNPFVAVGQGLSQAIPAISQLSTDEKQRQAIDQNISASKSQQAVSELDLKVKQRQEDEEERIINIKTSPMFLNAPPQLQNHIISAAKNFGADENGNMKNRNIKEMIKQHAENDKLMESFRKSASIGYAEEATKAYTTMQRLEEAGEKGSTKYLEAKRVYDDKRTLASSIEGKMEELIKTKETQKLAQEKADIDRKQYEAQYGEKGIEREKIAVARDKNAIDRSEAGARNRYYNSLTGRTDAETENLRQGLTKSGGTPKGNTNVDTIEIDRLAKKYLPKSLVTAKDEELDRTSWVVNPPKVGTDGTVSNMVQADKKIKQVVKNARELTKAMSAMLEAEKAKPEKKRAVVGNFYQQIQRAGFDLNEKGNLVPPDWIKDNPTLLQMFINEVNKK